MRHTATVAPAIPKRTCCSTRRIPPSAPWPYCSTLQQLLTFPRNPIKNKRKKTNLWINPSSKNVHRTLPPRHCFPPGHPAVHACFLDVIGRRILQALRTNTTKTSQATNAGPGAIKARALSDACCERAEPATYQSREVRSFARIAAELLFLLNFPCFSLPFFRYTGKPSLICGMPGRLMSLAVTDRDHHPAQAFYTDGQLLALVKTDSFSSWGTFNSKSHHHASRAKRHTCCKRIEHAQIHRLVVSYAAKDARILAWKQKTWNILVFLLFFFVTLHLGFFESVNASCFEAYMWYLRKKPWTNHQAKHRLFPVYIRQQIP